MKRDSFNKMIKINLDKKYIRLTDCTDEPERTLVF